jgi:arylsulfatase A-like enzyme
VVASVLTLAGLTVAHHPERPRAQTRPRPNVLVIVTDDQRPTASMGVMAKTRAWLGDGGTTYTNAVVTTPLCCPSRASILTGRFVHNHGVSGNNELDQVEHLDLRGSIQRYLGRAGYRTGIVGKFLNAWPLEKAPPGFDRWAVTPRSDAYRHPTLNVDGRIRRIRGYQTDIYGRIARGYLKDWEARDNAPWFLYLAPAAPHKPFTPQRAYADADVGNWTGNPAVYESNRSDKPPVVRRQDGTLADGLAVRTAQLRTLLSLDDMLERIHRALSALGERDTLVIFLSDNGFLWGEHGVVAEKRLPYAQSVGVPMLVRWPGEVPAGTTAGRLVANIDVLPTVLEAARIEPRATLPPIDGHTFLSGPPRKRLLLEYVRSADRSLYPGWAAIRTDDSLYVEWYRDDLRTVTFREYYDLAYDPWERDNLLGDAATGNDPDVSRLSEILAVERRCKGKTCWTPLR